MTEANKHYYIRGEIGRGNEVIEKLVEHGGENVKQYRGEGGHNTLYYIDKDGHIEQTEADSKLGYILLNSGWTELAIKQTKRNRYFLFKVGEGQPDCKNDCSKCNKEQMGKCRFADALQEMVGGKRKLNGSTVSYKELEFIDIPYGILI